MDTESVIPGLSTEFYVSLFEQAADGMFVADPQGRLIAVNPRLCDLLGFAAEEVLGRPLLDFVDPEDLQTNPARMAELRAGNAVVSERPLRCKDGRWIPIELTTRMLADSHLLGVGRDISERKLVKEALEIAHARLEALWSVSSLSGASPKAISDQILDSIVRMTRSACGFYGFINNDDESVMTNHAWSGEAMRDCSLVDRPREKAIGTAGVWGEAVRRRAPLILNDYAAAHEGKKGLPEGHVPLTRILVVPFFSRGKITAVAAVANRPTDYSQEDVVQLTSFLNSVETIADRARAEEALRESEARYRTLVEQASDGVVVMGAEGRFLSANQAFVDMLGYSGEELSKLCIRDLGAEDGPPGLPEGVSAGTAALFEWRLVRKDGSIVSVEASARTLADGRRLAIVRDVTGRKLAELALGEEDLPYGVVVAGLDSRLQRVNGVFGTLLGYAPEELIGKSVAELTRPDDRDLTQEHLARLKRREIEQFVVEKRYITRSGGTVHAVTFVRGLFAAGGALAGTIASVVDITERARAESELRVKETLLRATMDAVADGVLAVNEQGVVVFRNARFAELWRIPREIADSGDDNQLLGFVLDQLEDPEAFLAKVRALYQSGERSFDTLYFKDGRVFERLSCPLMNGDVIEGRVWSFRDVTERRRAEESQLELERRLLHAQKLESLGVLAGGIAHDFNNLLMAILGNLELGLRDLSPVSPARPRIDAADQAARRAADLTRQMLAYSGRGKFLIGRVDLNELVEENVHLLRTSIPRTVTLNLHLDRALPVVEADAGQLQQVIMNLITNAAEAIGDNPGVVALSTGVRDCDGSYLGRSRLDETPPAGCYAYFEVTDSGCGMDQETQQRMFDPFFTTKFTGRGLGLPAVFGIVRGHGGAIMLDSAAGKGTTIRVLFPAAEAALGAVAPAAGAPAGVAAEAPPGTGRGTILIVDDEEMVLQPCAAMVESMGFAVLTAVDGEQAVEVVRRHGAEIRAIILDLTMPKLDGVGALERILRIEPGAKVILSSGYDEAEATGRVAKEGLAGFIRKPYHLEQLQSTLERVLGAMH